MPLIYAPVLYSGSLGSLTGTHTCFPSAHQQVCHPPVPTLLLESACFSSLGKQILDWHFNGSSAIQSHSALVELLCVGVHAYWSCGDCLASLYIIRP